LFFLLIYLLFSNNSPVVVKIFKEKVNLFTFPTKLIKDYGCWYLPHANVAKHYGAYLDFENSQCGIVMDVLDCDLWKVINDEEPLKYKIQYIIDLACGMQFLHALGTVHYDLHPGNCLVRKIE
jgi:serine/threonine protein kinase